MTGVAPVGPRGPDLIAPPPLLYMVPLVAGLTLDRLRPLPRLPRRLRLAGLPLLGAGAGLAGWFFVTMERAGTPVDPREAPTALVVEGPFRHTRNPGYAGVTLFYAGVALLTGARWPLLFLPGVLTAVDRGVVRREERYLERKFGQAYEDYRRRVRRWL